MMALAGVELETLVSEPDALTTRPPPCAFLRYVETNCRAPSRDRNDSETQQPGYRTSGEPLATLCQFNRSGNQT